MSENKDIDESKAEKDPMIPDGEVNPINTDYKVGQDNVVMNLGPFGLDFIRVTHSIPEAVATFINTDKGTIIHTGDWNLDTDPAMGKPVDPHAFIKAGEKNVLAYVGDSTNAQVPGRTPSESLVEAGLTEVLKMQKKRVAITTFSSNLGRLKSISKARGKI